jgi:hypothetical protein
LVEQMRAVGARVALGVPASPGFAIPAPWAEVIRWTFPKQSDN